MKKSISMGVWVWLYNFEYVSFITFLFYIIAMCVSLCACFDILLLFSFFHLLFLFRIFHVIFQHNPYKNTRNHDIPFATHARIYFIIIPLILIWWWWVKVDVLCVYVCYKWRVCAQQNFRLHIRWLVCENVHKNKKWIENGIATSFIQQDDMPAEWAVKKRRGKKLTEQGDKPTKGKFICIKQRKKNEKKKFYSNFNELVIRT